MTLHPIAKANPGAELPGMFARYKSWVERELSRSLPDTGDAGLQVLLRYHLGWVDQDGRSADSPIAQGKALRPILCLFACEALSDNIERASSAAAALELIHNFSLIHDDIQDQDEERRHKRQWVPGRRQFFRGQRGVGFRRRCLQHRMCLHY